MAGTKPAGALRPQAAIFARTAAVLPGGAASYVVALAKF